ncbi:C25 family cysteine peptidase, partial [Acinetobacter baumannii]
FPLVSGSGGARYPGVNSAIVSKVSKGIFLFNYSGHGGYQRLADEAVLGADETKQFQNSTKLPLFITATCDFAPFDDPSKNSLGGSLL